MGAFGIFILVLTFVYVAYYAVVISMDLFGQDKKGKGGSVEVIPAGGIESKDIPPDEAPTEVDEEDYSSGGMDLSGDEVLSPEEIAELAVDQLYEAFTKSRGGMERIIPRAQAEYSLSTQADLAKQIFMENMDATVADGWGKKEGA